MYNKGVTEEDLIRSVKEAFENGWSAVKLYFMIGLPTETDEDVMGIADLAQKVRRVISLCRKAACARASHHSERFGFCAQAAHAL